MEIPGRNINLNEQNIAALERLKEVAQTKRFYAELIANLYNSSIKCNVGGCARYISGEAQGDTRLSDALLLILSLAAEGIESHEYLGQEFVEDIIQQWELKS